MFKKHIQNMILVLSVFVAFILVYQIWSSSYFLPGSHETLLTGLGRSILNPIIRLFDSGNQADLSEHLQTLLKPEKIVLNNAGKRLVYADGSESYRNVRKLASKLVEGGMEETYTLKARETVSEDAYLSALKGKSIYVDYGKACDFRLLSYGICGKEKNRFSDDLSAVSGYIIGLQDGILNDVSLYFRDAKSGTFYRYMIEADKTELTQEMDEMMEKETGGTSSYSYELNFHKEQEAAETKVLFNPMLLIDLAPAAKPQVEIVGDDEGRKLLGDGTVENILDAFSINNRTMRKYTDLNDARVFVENNATLTLYPEGMLVYQTVPGGRGLDLTGGTNVSGYDIYDATADAVHFAESLCRKIAPGLFDKLIISSDLVENADKQGYYRICFDYFLNGTRVRSEVDGTAYHAIEIEIENGSLKSYRQCIGMYDDTNGVMELAPMIQAADALVDKLYSNNEPLLIQSMKPCYIEQDGGKVTLAWCALVDNKEHIIR